MQTDEAMPERSCRISLARAGRDLLRLDRPEGDPPDEAARQAAAESQGVIALIWKAIRAEPVNRRREPRHPAVKPEVWVGWWSREDFGAVQGRLLNLSRNGARIVLGHRPPRTQSVWLYHDLGSTLSCVRGDVVGVTPAPDASYSVRCRFATPCPTDLCQSWVCAQPAARNTATGL